MLAVVTYWWSFQKWTHDCHCVFLVIYIYKMSYHTGPMLSNTRVYLRSNVRWSQTTPRAGLLSDPFSIHGTDDNIVLYQFLTSLITSHKSGLDRLDSHVIFFMTSLADNSIIHTSEMSETLILYVIWFIYTWLCNWHMFKHLSYLNHTICSLWYVS